MMGSLRVLVVEDSLTVRKRLCEALSADGDIEVVGEAEDGRSAIEQCMKQKPSVVTMDMIMPVMSGLSATEYIMAYCPTPILVVSSSFNRAGLFKTYDALAAGAVDVLEKPSGTEPDGEWERRLVAAVKLVSRIRVITHPRARLASWGGPRAAPGRTTSDRNGAGSSLAVIAIGASTGGPGAIVEILQALPASVQIPVLLVMHINEPFGRAFADWLDGLLERPVAYAKEGAPIAAAAGCIVMAPPDHHLIVRAGRFHLTRDPERHSCRPSVDVLFESVAQEYGPAAVACLLTGMGRDGAAGMLDVQRAGGVTIGQDEETSVVYGMPREAARIGAVQHVLRLDEIAPALASLATRQVAL